MSTEKKENILEEANRIIHGPRNEDYGHPMDDFSKTAKMWEGVFGKILKPGATITPEMVALAMVCVKISRLGNTPNHRDSIVDIAGYAGTLEMVVDERKRRQEEADAETLDTMAKSHTVPAELTQGKIGGNTFPPSLRVNTVNAGSKEVTSKDYSGGER